LDRKHVDLIIEGGVVVTMNPQHRIIHDGAVAVDGNAIVAVGSTEDVRRAFEAGRVLDAKYKAIMPGLVDTYGHAGHGMVKAIRHPELGWPTNHLYFHAADAGWWSAEGLLSAVERLRFGVTCGLTVIGATPARMDSPVFAVRQAEAVESVGIRGVLGVGPPDPFVTHLPEPWEGTFWEGDKPVRRQFTYEQTVRNSISFIEDWHGAADGRVRVALHYPYLFGRHATHPKFPFTYTSEHLPVVIEKADEIRDLADRYGVLLHSHAFRGSVTFGLEVFGPEHVRRLLGPDVILAHCNDLAPDEVRVLGEEGVNVALVPFTAENIVHGVCPAIELLQAGANVTISTDGTAPYCSYDLFKEISRAMWAQWTRLDDFRLLPPGKALRMVTIDAAQALGLDDHIGSLEVGKRADIILVDMNRPHLVPGSTIPRLLAFYANGNDVDTVLVDGTVLMQDRQVLSVDEGAIMDGAREAADRAFSRFDVGPYLETDEGFWLGWRH
jgi:cytosine/adenosine deaminase-related metal-dependent hydrolase